ncbi:DUF2680 domain-containing protein [Schinkia sp. CFF1]
MKKMMVLLGVLCLTLGLAMPAWAENNPTHKLETTVKLTEAQKQELAKIHQEILDKKFEMLDKHVEFGMMPKETAAKIKAKLTKKSEMMKKNGYMPRHCHHMDKDDAE